MKKKLAILMASAALLALVAAGCGQADTAGEEAADQETGMQIASAWLNNDENDTRTLATIDLSGDWSVEFAAGAFYMNEHMQSLDDEAEAMGVSLSKEVYDEYMAEAKESDSFQELDNAVKYTDSYDEDTDYLFTDGLNGYFLLTVDKDLDGDAVFQRVSVEAESGGQAVGYGQDSQLYTPEEMDAAVDVIMAEFDTWTGCAMNAVTYAGDECNTEENIQWLNSLKEGANYTQCIEFLTDFHSPVNEEDLKETAWEPDTDYTDYQWWLARTDGGQWELVSWGY